MDCEIDCHQRNIIGNEVSEGSIRACRESTIIGPTGYELRVECEENNSCQEADIHAEDSSQLNVTCTNPHSCCGTSFYCPRNATQDNMCQIHGMLQIIVVCIWPITHTT